MKKLGDVLAIFTIIMVLASFILVVIRYLFNIVPVKMQELVIYIHAIVFMLGFLYCYVRDGHVRIDIFYQKKKKSTQLKIDKAGTILLLFPFFIFIIVTSYEYVWSSIEKLEASGDAGGLPYVYLLKTLIIIMPISMIIAGFMKLVSKR